VLAQAEVAIPLGAAGVIDNTILYDPAYGWPPSRVIQFQIGKKW